MTLLTGTHHGRTLDLDAAHFDLDLDQLRDADEIAADLSTLSYDNYYDEYYDYDTQRDKPAKPWLPEVCVLCGWPLPLDRPWSECEFTPMDFCRCNGCIRPPKRDKGRQTRYCSGECESRVKEAMRRARRRRGGAKSRSFDAVADRMADYRLDMCQRARDTKADLARYQFDWTGIWGFPATRPRQSRYAVADINGNAVRIALIAVG